MLHLSLTEKAPQRKRIKARQEHILRSLITGRKPLKIIPSKEEYNIKSEEINPMDSRQFDPIDILKQKGNSLTNSLTSIQNEGSFCIKQVRYIRKKKG